MGFFNKLRHNLFKGNAAAKYIAYAIGEVVLVVIGILIAVTINNANERKKENQLLITYLSHYRNDLKIDSTLIASNLKMLDAKKEAFNLVLSDSLNKSNLMANKNAFGLLFNYNPIKIQTKGFSKLQSYVAENNREIDTLVTSIISNHSTYKELIDVSIKRIGDDIDGNLDYLKNNKLWLSDFLANTITPEIIDYFLSRDYKNRAAIHKTYVYDNLYAIMQSYQKYMVEINKEIDERLK